MYQCEHCGSDTPEHVCPDPDAKGDVEVKSDSTELDPRAAHLRQHDETEAQWRLRRILEMFEEGLNVNDIGPKVDVSAESVRNILQKERKKRLEEPLTSSLAVSLTNHTPSKADLEHIKEIRLKADELCRLIDHHCREGRETDLAKQYLEETTMWAVKSLVLPREAGKALTTQEWQQREAQRMRDEA